MLYFKRIRGEISYYNAIKNLNLTLGVQIEKEWIFIDQIDTKIQIFVYEILKKRVKNKKITWLGVTFKATTDDMRDSSRLTMIPALSKKGAIIKYFDPTRYKKEFKKIKNVSFADSIKKSLDKSDLVIIHTEWNDFKSINFKNLSKRKKFIIYDMRNIYSSSKIKAQGFRYFSVGR